jgi:hypothetical protein
MTIIDKIQVSVQQLPTAFQAELLDFVEYLLAKTNRGIQEHEADPRSDLSLPLAMRGMEDEDSPHYQVYPSSRTLAKEYVERTR